MELAIELLGSSFFSIEEIACKCGFSGTPSFSRKFKQEFDTSPSMFRKVLLANDLKFKAWRVPLDEKDIIQIVYLSRRHYWLNELLIIVIKNLNNNITVSNLSQLLFMDISTLNRKVNDLFGISTKRLVLDLKLDFAAKTLITQDKEIRDIGLNFNFYDSSHFSNSFKQVFGCSPKMYKKEVEIFYLELSLLSVENRDEIEYNEENNRW